MTGTLVSFYSVGSNATIYWKKKNGGSWGSEQSLATPAGVPEFMEFHPNPADRDQGFLLVQTSSGIRILGYVYSYTDNTLTLNKTFTSTWLPPTGSGAPTKGFAGAMSPTGHFIAVYANNATSFEYDYTQNYSAWAGGTGMTGSTTLNPMYVESCYTRDCNLALFGWVQEAGGGSTYPANVCFWDWKSLAWTDLHSPGNSVRRNTRTNVITVGCDAWPVPSTFHFAYADTTGYVQTNSFPIELKSDGYYGSAAGWGTTASITGNTVGTSAAARLSMTKGSGGQPRVWLAVADSANDIVDVTNWTATDGWSSWTTTLATVDNFGYNVMDWGSNLNDGGPSRHILAYRGTGAAGTQYRVFNGVTIGSENSITEGVTADTSAAPVRIRPSWDITDPDQNLVLMTNENLSADGGSYAFTCTTIYGTNGPQFDTVETLNASPAAWGDLPLDSGFAITGGGWARRPVVDLNLAASTRDGVYYSPAISAEYVEEDYAFLRIKFDTGATDVNGQDARAWVEGTATLNGTFYQVTLSESATIQTASPATVSGFWSYSPPSVQYRIAMEVASTTNSLAHGVHAEIWSRAWNINATDSVDPDETEHTLNWASSVDGDTF